MHNNVQWYAHIFAPEDIFRGNYVCNCAIIARIIKDTSLVWWMCACVWYSVEYYSLDKCYKYLPAVEGKKAIFRLSEKFTDRFMEMLLQPKHLCMAIIFGVS